MAFTCSYLSWDIETNWLAEYSYNSALQKRRISHTARSNIASSQSFMNQDTSRYRNLAPNSSSLFMNFLVWSDRAISSFSEMRSKLLSTSCFIGLLGFGTRTTIAMHFAYFSRAWSADQ